MKRIKTCIFFVVTVFLLTACSNTDLPSASSGEAFSQYAIGDIILTDGSVVKAKDFTAVDDKNYPIAVIAGYKDNGKAFGIGVHRSNSPLQWATENSAGYTARVADTVCTQNSVSEFAGDRDGIDNWEAVCAIDEKGAANAAENYPAFDFVNTYARIYNLSGAYSSGWYMPSIAELCEVYQNREAVNSSLQKISGLNPDAAMDGLDTNWYWSSSQADSEKDYAWFVHYYNGYAGECPKNFANLHVLAVREF